MVTVQIATSRAGVPHARSFARWANAAFAGAAARRTSDSSELTIRIVGAAECRKLNRTWRGKDKPTNVLSFVSDHELGDLAICAPVVAREAREQGKPADAHHAHLLVHGLLHLQGMVGSAHDGRLVRADGEGTSPETVGLEVAERLLAQGARALIDAHVE